MPVRGKWTGNIKKFCHKNLEATVKILFGDTQITPQNIPKKVRNLTTYAKKDWEWKEKTNHRWNCSGGIGNKPATDIIFEIIIT